MKQQILIIGNLGKDATISKVANWDVLNFNVAVTETNLRNGFKFSTTKWYPVAFWFKEADTKMENFVKYLTLGSKVCVQTENFEFKSYTNKEGKTVQQIQLNVFNRRQINLLHSTFQKEADNDTVQQEGQPLDETPQVPETGLTLEDLPF
ncbi:MAG: single-stranded DNA-binding protein [Chitinophagaceae bacterium]|jgi:single-stranded DNA-binding protein|nr:single-stranded DNA-binding protein [Chitinophagaceae bacterium]